MLKFIKSFGLGLLYMILSPILLCVLAGYAVYGLYNFAAVGIKGTIRFFKGQSFFPPFEEDIKAERILNKGLEPEEEKAPAPVQQAGTTNVYVQQNIYQGVPQANQQQQLPPLPNARIPDIPGINQGAMNQINQQIGQAPIPTLSVPNIQDAQQEQQTPPVIEVQSMPISEANEANEPTESEPTEPGPEQIDLLEEDDG